MLNESNQKRTLFRIRSFVRRGGRGTTAQARAQDVLGPQYMLDATAGVIDRVAVFGRDAPCFLEIGFGDGQSLLAAAKAHPDKDFVGIETHKPGIGKLLLKLENEKLDNLRLIDADVIDVLAHCIAPLSLAGVQLFFPDPWQKRRHHARRLIQPAFIQHLLSKMKPAASLHIATDWDDYACHVERVLLAEVGLVPSVSAKSRSPYRPIITKFERRALKEGRPVHEFQFEKVL